MTRWLSFGVPQRTDAAASVETRRHAAPCVLRLLATVRAFVISCAYVSGGVGKASSPEHVVGRRRRCVFGAGSPTNCDIYAGILW